MGGAGGLPRGIRPPPPPAPPLRASPGGVTYALATRSAARGSRPGAVRVVGTAGRAKAATLWTPLPSMTAVQPHRLYQGESRDTIREWGITQIMPG